MLSADHTLRLAERLFVRYTIRMKSGPFIALFADAYCVEERTVQVFARALKEGGLMTTGARGVNAPDMLPLDAARLTIALLSTDSPARALEGARRFGQLPACDVHAEHESSTLYLAEIGDSFEKVLVRIFETDRNDNSIWTVRPFIEVNETFVWIEISWSDGDCWAIFREPEKPGPDLAQTRPESIGLQRVRSLNYFALKNIWSAMQPTDWGRTKDMFDGGRESVS